MANFNHQEVANLILNELENLGFPSEKLTSSSSFDVLGVDSLALMEILVAVEKRMGIKVSVSELLPEALTSVARFAQFIVDCKSA